MSRTLVACAVASAVAFTFYGSETLFHERIQAEFLRYGMSGARRAVGTLQLLGAGGVLMGLWVPRLGALAALGLALMMLFGLVVRIWIHDSPRVMIPAFTLCIINVVLVVLFLRE